MEVTELQDNGTGDMVEVVNTYGGDVTVMGRDGGEAIIQVMSIDGPKNTSDSLICAEGNVSFTADGGVAAMISEAKFGNENNANTGISAKGDDGILVRALNQGRVYIASEAFNGYNNNAQTLINAAAGKVIVLDEGGELARTAEISARAQGGVNNDAYVGVAAKDDIIVAAGITLEDLDSDIIPESGMGGYAAITAIATPYSNEVSAAGDSIQQPPTTANAETVVYSHAGGVAVIDATGGGVGSAEISAEAYGAHKNTASVGVSAGGDLLNEDHPSYEEYKGIGVLVLGSGSESEAQILAWAHDARPIDEFPQTIEDTQTEPIPGENTADVVICTPGEVQVAATEKGGQARIKSRAGWWNDYGSINKATTQVYAGEVDVDVPGLYRGNGIWAYAIGVESNPRLPADFIMTEYDDKYGNGEFIWIGEGVENDSLATLMVRDYSERKDCPECPPCPDCEEETTPIPLAPPAPLYTPQLAQGGCPGLMQWLANEIGVPAGQIQVAVAGAFALNTNMQPCDMCARLAQAALTMQDPAGIRLAALTQVINEFVATPVPPSPEQMTSIAAAFAEHVDDGTHYANAGQLIDAIVAYISIMRTEMGYSMEDATAFAEKYMTPINEAGNAALTAYVQSRIAALEG